MSAPWRRVTGTIALVVVSCGAHAGAQVISRATPPPERTAVATEWYAARTPIFVGGEWYEPAGASVFFDGNTMVPIASTDGVPLYADTTIEPHSIVFVPIGRGLVQPYERRRTGDLAGTTGSRAPSFPVDSVTPATALGLSQPRQFSGSVESDPGRDPVRVTTGSVTCPATTGRPAPVGPVTTARPPEGSRGIWVPFDGQVWVSDGPAVAFDPGRFTERALYRTFPVYRLAGDEDRIYLPGIDGVVAPYRRTTAAAP